MLQKLNPNMMVKNVQETLQFYQDHFDFTFVMGVPKDTNEILFENDFKRPLVYGLLKYESIEIMFQEEASLMADIPYFSNRAIVASVSFYFEVEDVDILYGKLKGKAPLVKDLQITWYGMKEFYVLDCNGYVLGFACREARDE